MILSTQLENGLKPDLFDNTNPDVIYFGYFGTVPDLSHCLIKRVTKATIDGKIIRKVEYPFGRFEWAYAWADRLTVTDWRYRDFPAVGGGGGGDLYTLTVVGGTADKTQLAAGETAIITADVPVIGYAFKEWTGDVSVIDDIAVPSTIVTMPAADVVVTSDYQLITIELIYSDINNTRVVQVYGENTLYNWNVAFGLDPVNTANSFTSLVISGNKITLSGIGVISNIQWNNDITNLFINDLNLLSVIDTGCITSITSNNFVGLLNCTEISLKALTSIGNNCFSGLTLLTSLNLPSLITAGDSCFNSCQVLPAFNLPNLISIGDSCFYVCFAGTTFNLPKCATLGSTVGANWGFYLIAGNIVTLTIPAALMICNGGAPDGDIQYLQANNTVTIITV